MTDKTQTRMTRREALKGGSAAAVAAGAYLMQEQIVQAAAAQTNEPRIQLGQDYVIDDDPDGNGDLVIEHTPTGAELRYDSSVDAWVPTGQIGDGTTSADHASVTTEDLVDGGGASHTGRIADLGELFQVGYDKTVGGGSITDNQGVIQVREPGNASSQSSSRLYHHLLDFDTAASSRVRVNLSNVTVDNDGNARIQFAIRDTPDAADLFSGDLLGVQVDGSGRITAVNIDDGTESQPSDTSQDNTYVNSLNYMEFSWDGSTTTIEVSDGSTTITESVSSNYPSDGTLFLTLRARDRDGSNARNVDFDIDDVVVSD